MSENKEQRCRYKLAYTYSRELCGGLESEICHHTPFFVETDSAHRFNPGIPEHPTGSPAPNVSDAQAWEKQDWGGKYWTNTSARVDSPAEGAEQFMRSSVEWQSLLLLPKAVEFAEAYAAHERECAERFQRERDEAIHGRDQWQSYWQKATLERNEARRQCANEVQIAQREIELREKAEDELAALRKQIDAAKHYCKVCDEVRGDNSYGAVSLRRNAFMEMAAAIAAPPAWPAEKEEK